MKYFLKYPKFRDELCVVTGKSEPNKIASITENFKLTNTKKEIYFFIVRNYSSLNIKGIRQKKSSNLFFMWLSAILILFYKSGF